MKCLKMLGLAAIAAGALMAFAGTGTASATELTCTNPPGTKVMCPTGTVIHMVSEGRVVYHNPTGSIECESTIEGTTANTGGSSETLRINISTLTFVPCIDGSVVVLRSGTLELHTISGTHDATLTTTGTEVTVEQFGFHCIFATSNTDIGRVTGSGTTGGTAKLDLSGTIPRTGGRSGAFCGSGSAITGSYKITTPDWAEFD